MISMLYGPPDADMLEAVGSWRAEVDWPPLGIASRCCSPEMRSSARRLQRQAPPTCFCMSLASE
jgi:hypothetical protein